MKRVCIIHEGGHELRLDFLRAHVDRLPCETLLIHDFVPSVAGEPLLPQAPIARALRKGVRTILGEPWSRELTDGYLKGFRRFKPDAVLAEWGPVAVRVMDACDIAGVPLIAHFHGYDASVYNVLDAHRLSYLELFRRSAAVVVVSRDMARRLIAAGAHSEKIRYNPCGVDVDAFPPAQTIAATPTFVAVGRFVEKKGPHLTIEAFASALRVVPDARLVMVGDGPLLGACQALVRALGIEHAAVFTGLGDRAQIINRMRSARAFLLHSIVSSDGDAEGTPVVILEAGASGLPVISTRHAGIPDIVLEGETGLLVDEGDVQGMARHIVTLAQDAGLAFRLGQAARWRIGEQFTLDHSIGRLWTIIEESIAARPDPAESAV